MISRALLTILVVLIIQSAAGQAREKSLKDEIEKSDNDTVRVQVLLKLSEFYSNEGVKVDSALALANQAFEIASRINYAQGVFDATMRRASVYYYNKSERTRGSEEYSKALTLANQLNNFSSLARIHYVFGIINNNINDTVVSVQYFRQAYQFAVKSKDEKIFVITLTAILSDDIDHNRSLERIRINLDSLVKIAKDSEVKAIGWDMLSEIYRRDGKTEAAIHTGELAAEGFRKEGARKYALFEQLLNLSRLYRNNDRLDLAKKRCEEVIKSGASLQNIPAAMAVAKAYSELSNVYAAEHNYKMALTMANKGQAFMDSTKNVESIANLQKLRVQFDADRQKLEIEMLNKDNQILAHEEARQRQLLFFLALACLVLVASSIFFFRANSRRKRINNLLETRNQLIQKQHTELQQALKDLRETQEYLVHSEKLASLGKMTAGIAHEINNPVNFVQVGAESLNDCIKDITQLLEAYDQVDVNDPQALKRIESLKQKLKYKELVAEIHGLIKAIRSGTGRASAIIAGLQRFSRKGGEENVERDLQELIEDTVMLVRTEAKDRVKIECTYQEGIRLECRQVELGQVFMNLLINAMHAIKERGSVFVNTMKKGTHVEISIRDTGTGIAPENLSKIFDPFFTTKDVGKGTGLGLSITHGIVKNHRGDISVKSVQGEGTEFTIVLPLKQS